MTTKSAGGVLMRGQGVFELSFPGFKQAYPFVASASDATRRIVYINDMTDRMDLLHAASKALSAKLVALDLVADLEVVVAPGDSANALVALLVAKLQEVNPRLELAILRTNAKGGSHRSVCYQSISSATAKHLHMRADQFNTLARKRVLIFDDIISTGASVGAVGKLLAMTDAQVVAYACVATAGENDAYPPEPTSSPCLFHNRPLLRLAHLPVLSASKEP